ncbi:MAG TPA: MarR family transcriptional regulator [Jatrophihabitans sp.]|jgi:DNA-binding MarR family transcriptional regulator|uniref:MarR family winged helix-turn-helix transcriptional regulator n=1 Tax=Jatrophihabitans sp. TaxID=1932789 RepID=UPI002DFD3758|nr:MarR family transcriptional regulator [Jatrophihabitans sp.]
MARTTTAPTADPLTLDDQLCFALYAASRAMTARYRPYLDALGLTYPQYLVLIVLWDEGPATVSTLGERLRLDSGTLSPLLKRLETNGLITRARRPEDERSVEIRTTPKGKRLQGRAARIPPQIRASLDGVDQHRLMDALHDLEAALRDA